MKRTTIRIGFRKKDDERIKRSKKAATAFADVFERVLSEKAFDADLEYEGYLEIMVRISEHVEDGRYDDAMDLMYLITLLLDDNLRCILVDFICGEDYLEGSFLERIAEIIDEKYVDHDFFDECCDCEECDECEGDCENCMLDKEYEWLKSITEKEGDDE